VIGVDIGGTFTDCIVVSDEGNVTIGKAPSTPPDFHTGFMEAMRAAARRMGVPFEEVIDQADGIYHGCTVGTNALVESRTAKVGLLTTRGHKDVLFTLQAGGRLVGLPPEVVAHVAAQTKDEPLVPKGLVGEVSERITFDGEILSPLNEEACRGEIQRLIDAGAEAFSVSLLWSIVNPVHEVRVRELIEELAPGAFVSISSEVIPRSGEFERTVATVMNSLIGPAMSNYLEALEKELRVAGYDKTLQIMTCSGGLIDSGYARKLPVLTIDSGPVAGLIGAGSLSQSMAKLGGLGDAGLDVITTDMGGTTLDVGVIREGAPLSRATSRHGQYEYFVPTLDVKSIGAGGGSIIHFDEDTGTLRVGPRSAGSRPGPAAYLRGGTEATITDAGLVLGYLNPDFFLGGEMAVGIDAAREALARAGAPLGFDAEQTAAAAIRIVDNHMADAIRLASVHQGHDPRKFVMYAYGGGGPVHATAFARELGMPRVVVPLADLAAGWSAFGVASSDALVVEEAPLSLTQPFDVEALNDAWAALEANAFARLERQGIERGQVTFERIADVRYTMQVNQIAVQAPPGVYRAEEAARVAADFEREYERLFGKGSGYADAGILLTAVRVRASAPITSFAPSALPEPDHVSHPSPVGTRGVIWYERGLEREETPIYRGSEFVPGSQVEGPAIVEFDDTTLVIRHDQHADVDRLGSVVVTIESSLHHNA
jgi:N-methylhydantoinase A